MDTSMSLSVAKQALLAQRLKKFAPSGVAVSPIPPRPNRDRSPLSFAQRQMWVIDQMTPGNPAYNLPNGYRIRGRLDVSALERAANEIIRRHEILRTTFAVADGEPLQFIHPELRIGIRTLSLKGLSGGDRETRLHALALEEALQSFDLTRLPLLRLTLFALDDREHILIANFHHIIADGISIGLFLKELDAFYRMHVGEPSPRLDPPTVQYGDFAQWESTSAANNAHAAQLEFWRAQLRDAPPALELPVDRVRPPAQSFNGSNVFFDIPAPLVAQLRTLAAIHGCTFFMAVLGALNVLLHRYTAMEDLVIGTPLGARAPAVDSAIGNFLNMTVLRCDVSHDPTFAELLHGVRHTTLNAFSNSEVPFEAILKQLRFERDPSRNPVFQVLLQVLAAPAPRIGDLDVENFHFDLGIAQFDLALHLYEEGNAYRGRFEYCTALFERETIERIARNYVEILHAVTSDPRRRISEMTCLASSERDQVLTTWNATAANVEGPLRVHELVEAQARRTPCKTAVVADTGAVSYAELNARANRIAHTLRARGVRCGQRVGLCLERGMDMVAALLGVLKTGAAYVPLDPLFPAARLQFMAEDAQLAVLVTTSTQAHCAPMRDGALLLDRDADALAAAPAQDLPLDERAGGADAPAYVIYTSGSTGRPKGVVIPHRAVLNFLWSMSREPGLSAEDVVIAVTTLSFDIAVLELVLPLACGARVVIATREQTVSGNALSELLDRHGATLMQATPTTWRLLLETGWKGHRPFKALVGGEPLPQDLATQLIARGAELWNMYGPTETTIWSTCARVFPGRGIRIGRPIANTTARVLDARGALCPIGVPGELHIGGAGLALGYWNRPQLTAERFVADPYASIPGALLYRTGDCVRWCADGMLEHLGRLDTQIKLRGFRIETGEVESVLAQYPAIREVAVQLLERSPGDRQLAAFFTSAEAGPDLTERLRAHARALLPDYMVPAQFVRLDALPKTPNGKVDRKALLPRDLPASTPGGAATTPRTATEALVMRVFSEVLGRTDLGVLDNFFDLGGDSLMAARILYRLQAASGLDLPLRALFERQTVAGIALVMDAMAWTLPNTTPEKRSSERECLEL
jgi:amino acid adenylation domain-containing protein